MTDLDAAPASSGCHPFPALFAPGNIGGLELKNRVLMAPMEKNLCTADGVVTARYIDYLVERARADVALLRMEATYVDPVGKGRPFQAGAHSDAIIPALTRLTAAVRAAGGRTSVELAHCGRQTSSLVTGRQPVAPSAVPCLASGGFMPRPLTPGEIADIVQRFAMAATRAKASGVDAIEIHGASGYLINAFMSPYTNLRDDEYGSTLENRMRFPLEVVAAVKGAVGPEMPLLYRMSADDFVPGGVTTADSGPLAAALEAAGVDLIDVSAGTYESILATQPPMEAEPGTLVPLAAKIKQYVSIPIATAGKLVHLDVAERAVSSGDIDFVTIGRGLHADPELLTKARSGRLDRVRRCIACAECVASLGQDQPAYCAINPTTLRERTLGPHRADVPKRVVVVGGGPAGMEAAHAARLRGHSVRLLERDERVGGQVRFGALVDGRQDFAEPIHFLETELRRLGVLVSCRVDVDAELVEAMSPDATIVATGTSLVPPPVPGRHLEHVIASSDYLAYEERSTGDAHACPEFSWLDGAESVVVLGGSWIGCHVACLLLERRLRVAIVESHDALGYDMGAQQGAVLRRRIVDHPGTSAIYLDTTVEGIAPDHIDLWQSQPSTSARFPADAVVLVDRRQPNHDLAAAVAKRCGTSVEIFEIGDCVTPRKLQDAMLEGATVAACL
jgi:2,4-dienoyl-CoA reductase-like NADH-dependent reductase (Old Yellow Enzyme family)/thioredoxin reductase